MLDLHSQNIPQHIFRTFISEREGDLQDTAVIPERNNQESKINQTNLRFKKSET